MKEFYMAASHGDVWEGASILLGERGCTLSQEIKPEGQWVISPIKAADKSLMVICKNNTVEILYGEPVHFYRALGLLLAHLERSDSGNAGYECREEVQFRSSGAMLDCSRNAVLTVSAVKKYIRYMAWLGMNRLMLYTEDTYEVEGYPYFGLMRGRFTPAELEECDKYGALFGIELIPCIQTLAHLKTALHWPAMEYLKDTADILMTGDDRSYDLIRAMIKSVSSHFMSRKIHLGMDEAHDLGLGNYLNKFGFTDRFEIMKTHMERVSEICKEMGLEPMIWSDMYFRLQSPDREYYDVPEDADFSRALKPEPGVGLVYWDYYHGEKEFYSRYLKLHKQLGDQVVFAGGGWTWNGISPNYGMAQRCINESLTACREQGIEDVLCTFWQDNGAETPMEAGLPMLTLFAEHGFCRDLDMERVKERFRFCFGCSWDDFLMLNCLDAAPGVPEENHGDDNPSKWLLYQDVMTGLFDGQIKGLGLSEYYTKLAAALEGCAERNEPFGLLFRYYHRLAVLLGNKAELGIELKEAYDRQDKQELARLANDIIPACMKDAELLRELRAELWFANSRPFGYEILDIRFGGVKVRLESAQNRIRAWLDGKTESLPELEEPRLPYRERTEQDERKLCACNEWHSIVSAGIV